MEHNTNTNTNNTGKYMSIFARYFSAPEFRELDFSALNMEQKLSALADMGLRVDADAVYPVTREIRRDKFETEPEFIQAVAKFAPEKLGPDFWPIKADAAVSVTAKIKGKDLSQRDQISVLSREMKTDAGKIRIPNKFAGANFVAWCNWLRGLTEEEFAALQNK